jgi:oxygen-dependent protoporphyrinogen oxidase
MKRVAIVGGGIAGLAAAYELEKQRLAGADLDWQLYEANERLGGTVSTTRKDGFVLEDGPDGWVTEKQWARDLAVELGLKDELISSNDATRKTYILINGKLEAMPDGMRMMVPESLESLEGCGLFSDAARASYAGELQRADELRASAPTDDESVASFVRRHFGEEVLEKIGAPLLSGVFGGDVAKLSVQAVMPGFVTMEREHGSLIAAVQAKLKARGGKAHPPIFTTLRHGMGSLVEAIVAKLPAERIHLCQPAVSLKREGKLWCLKTMKETGKAKRHFQHVLLATPIDATKALLQPLDAEAGELVPSEASSAVLATFCWNAEAASTFTVPGGFGFLVPPNADAHDQLLAGTFVDQKFDGRAPAGARVVRAFFGGASAAALMPKPDASVASAAFAQLSKILGKLPEPEAALTTVRRWPRSLPQYGVGHGQRIARLEGWAAKVGGVSLLGNAYRGVGVPDLIRDARAAARNIVK